MTHPQNITRFPSLEEEDYREAISVGENSDVHIGLQPRWRPQYDSSDLVLLLQDMPLDPNIPLLSLKTSIRNREASGVWFRGMRRWVEAHNIYYRQLMGYHSHYENFSIASNDYPYPDAILFFISSHGIPQHHYSVFLFLAGLRYEINENWFLRFYKGQNVTEFLGWIYYDVYTGSDKGLPVYDYAITHGDIIFNYLFGIEEVNNPTNLSSSIILDYPPDSEDGLTRVIRADPNNCLAIRIKLLYDNFAFVGVKHISRLDWNYKLLISSPQIIDKADIVSILQPQSGELAPNQGKNKKYKNNKKLGPLRPDATNFVPAITLRPMDKPDAADFVPAATIRPVIIGNPPPTGGIDPPESEPISAVLDPEIITTPISPPLESTDSDVGPLEVPEEQPPDNNTIINPPTEPLNPQTTVVTPENVDLPKEQESLLDQLVKEALEVIMQLGQDDTKNLASTAEAIIFSAMAVSAEKFWNKVMLGLAALYNVAINKSVLATLSSYVFPALFGTNELSLAAMHTIGLRDNLKRSRIYDLISFMLIPFSTDLDLSLGDIKLLHVECAKKIDSMSLLEAVTAGAEYIQRGAQILKDEHNLSGFSIGDSKILLLTKRFISINTRYVQYMNSPGDAFDFVGGYMEADALVPDCELCIRKAKNPLVLKALSTMLFSLTAIASTYAAKAQAGHLIPAAYAISIFAASQLGKSSLMMYIMQYIARIDGETSQIVTAKGDEKFLEHIDNQTKYLILDDVANVAPEYAERSPLDLFLRLKNNVSTPIDQAAVERKGKVVPVLNVIGITTNVSDFNSSVYSVMSSSIVLRCNLHVNIVLKDEFKSPSGTLDQGKVQAAFPQVDGVTPLSDIWEISVYYVQVKPGNIAYRDDFLTNCVSTDTPWKLVPYYFTFDESIGPVPLKNIDVHQFLTFIGEDYKKYRKNQIQFVEEIKTTDFSSVYCFGCANTKLCCSCAPATQRPETGVLEYINPVKKVATHVYSRVASISYSKIKRWIISTGVTRSSSYYDEVVREEIERLDKGISSVFGFHMPRDRLFLRLKLLCVFLIDVLSESKLLHGLTLMPDKQFNMTPLEPTVKLMETDTIIKRSVSAAYDTFFSLIVSLFSFAHLGVLGVLSWLLIDILQDIFGFVVYPKVTNAKVKGLPLLSFSFRRAFFIAMYIFATYLTIKKANIHTLKFGYLETLRNIKYDDLIEADRSRYSEVRYGIDDFVKTFKRDEIPKIKRLSPIHYVFGKHVHHQTIPEKVQNWRHQYRTIPKLSWGVFYTFSGTFFLTILFYIKNKIEISYSEAGEKYIKESVRKILIARRKIEPYKAYIIERLTEPGVQTQSGPSEHYLKEWERLNKEPFETHLRSKDEIEYPIKHNLLVLDDGKENCMALMLRTGKMMIPLHFIHSEERSAKATRYANPIIGNSSFSVNIGPSNTVQIANKDLGIVNIASNTFTDIIHLFPDFVHDEPPSGIRFHKSKDGTLVKTVCTSHDQEFVRTTVYNPLNKSYIYNMLGFKYTAPNGLGLCGSPIISGSKKTYIKGIHIAGCTRDSNASYGIPVCSGEIRAAIDNAPIQTPSLAFVSPTYSPFKYVADLVLPVQSPSAHIKPDRRFGFLGRIGGYTKMSNKVFEHSISKELAKQGIPNQWGSPLPDSSKGEKKYTPTDNWLDKVTRENKPIKNSLLIRAQQDWLEPLLPLAKESTRLRVLNRGEIVNGSSLEPFINKIDMSTSPGFSHSGKKCDWGTLQEDGSWMIKKEIWDEVTWIENALLAGNLPVVPAQITGKMEVRKIGKGMRQFANVPFCMLLLLKKYYGSIFSFLVEHWKLSECAIGINPYNSDWDDLKKHMDQGYLSSWHAEDVSAFDQNVIPLVLEFFGLALVEIAKLGKYSKKEIKIMINIIAMLTHPTVIINGDLLELIGLMLSGIFGTTHFDSGMVSLLHRAHFFEVYGVKTKHRYRDFARLMCFGDDSIENTYQLMSYNSRTYAEFCAKYGITVTDSFKNPVTSKGVKIDEVSFLKRGFRFCKIRDRFVGPIEIDSIFKSLHCYVESKHVEADDVLRINLDTAVSELCLHTEKTYNDYIGKLRNIDHPVIKSVPAIQLSYRQAIDRLEEKSLTPETRNALTVSTLQAESGELDTKGPVSKVATAIADAASLLSVVPSLGPLAKATEDVSRSVAGAADLFGFSKPHQIVDHYTNPTTSGSFAPGNINDNVSKLTIDVRQELSVAPLVDPGSPDPMAFATIFDRWSFLRAFDWTTSAAEGDSLGFVKVDPSFCIYYEGSTPASIAFNPLSGVATHFAYYTGDLEYKIVIVASQYHKGRILVQFDPCDFDPDGPDITTLNTTLNYELCLETNKATTITIPPSRTAPYVRMHGIPNNDNFGPLMNEYFSGTAYNAANNSFFSNGSICFMVLQKLSVPLSAGNAGAKILVFVKPKPNFRLARPNDVLSRLYPLRPESGSLQENVEMESPQTTTSIRVYTPSTAARESSNLTPGSVVERPIKIGKLESVPTESDTGLSIDPWSTCFDNPRVVNRLNNYRNFRADLEVTAVVSSTPYYYGLYLLYYIPYYDEFDTMPTGTGALDWAARLAIEFSQPHVIIDITQNPTVKMHIPYLRQGEYLNLVDGSASFLGRLYLTPITPLRAVGDTPTQPMTITLYARLVNIKVKGLTTQQLSALVPQSGPLDIFETETMNLRENGEIHPEINVEYMGESIVSFRPLCRRYCLHKAYDLLDDTGTSTDVGCKIVVPGFPLYRGPQGTTYPGDVTAADAPYNYCNLTWLQLVTLMHHTVRGSIRYKIIPFSYLRNVFWSARVRHTEYDFNEDEPLGLDNIPIGSTRAAKARFFKNTHMGSAISHSAVNPILSVEVPYQTNDLFSIGRQTNEIDYPRLVLTGAGLELDATIAAPIHFYVATGEDFQVSWFRGLPLMVYSLVWPASQT